MEAAPAGGSAALADGAAAAAGGAAPADVPAAGAATRAGGAGGAGGGVVVDRAADGAAPASFSMARLGDDDDRLRRGADLATRVEDRLAQIMSNQAIDRDNLAGILVGLGRIDERADAFSGRFNRRIDEISRRLDELGRPQRGEGARGERGDLDSYRASRAATITDEIHRILRDEGIRNPLDVGELIRTLATPINREDPGHAMALNDAILNVNLVQGLFDCIIGFSDETKERMLEQFRTLMSNAIYGVEDADRVNNVMDQNRLIITLNQSFPNDVNNRVRSYITWLLRDIADSIGYPAGKSVMHDLKKIIAIDSSKSLTGEDTVTEEMKRIRDLIPKNDLIVTLINKIKDEKDLVKQKKLIQGLIAMHEFSRLANLFGGSEGYTTLRNRASSIGDAVGHYTRYMKDSGRNSSLLSNKSLLSSHNPEPTEKVDYVNSSPKIGGRKRKKGNNNNGRVPSTLPIGEFGQRIVALIHAHAAKTKNSSTNTRS